MRISSKEKIKTIKNKSFDSQSIISSDYIFLKNGNIKRKRNKNSYFETFLEKRRMAAEFAQSKRCYSTVSTKITYMNKNNKLSLHGLQDIINMNNLKHNLPGKAKPIIDNSNITNKNDLDNFIIQNNINNNNNSLSQPNFDEIKHLTNKSNGYNNNLNPPYELGNENEETSKFGYQDKIIDTNKSRKIDIFQDNNIEINEENQCRNYNSYRLKNKNNTYIKKRPIRDEKTFIPTLRQSKNQEINNNNNSQVEASISFRNDLNNNNKSKNNNNNNNTSRNIKLNSNDFSIKFSESKNNDIIRYIDTNNNEENDNNINYFNNINQKNSINEEKKINNNIAKKEILESNRSNQDEISNNDIEETNVIKINDSCDDNYENNNLLENKNEVKNFEINYDDNNKMEPVKKINEKEKQEINNKKENNIKNQELKPISITQNYLKIPKINIFNQEKEKVILKDIKPKKNNYNIDSYSIMNNYKNNNNSNTIDNNFSPSKNNKFIRKNNQNKINIKNDNKENKNLFSLMINKDIERLNKLKQRPKKNNEELKYYNELNNLINQIKGKRYDKNNEYINMNNENREKLLELENKKKDLKLFQSQINTALNYNRNRINFKDIEENINEKSNILKHNDNNKSNDFNNIAFESKNTKNNKFKINISTRMQNLLNKLEKEKISNNIDENDGNDFNKSIFTQNVINSINNFIKEGNNQIIPNNSNIINNINNINSNNQSNNFILLQNYYNNDNKKYKKIKNNYNNNYITYDNISYITDRNFNSDRENNDNFYSNMNKDNVKILDEKLFKIIKNKNTRLSKSRPSINLNLSKPNINIFENQNNKYGITSNNSRGFGKSIDYSPFIESQTFLEKVKDDLQNKNNDIEQYKPKNKRNTYYSDYYKINNNNNPLNKNFDINIMPANNIKSIFQYSKFKK